MSKTTKSKTKKAVAAVEETLDKISDTVENVVENVVEDASKAVKKTAAKAKTKAAAKKAEPAALIPEIFVQWDDSEVSMAAIVEKAQADFKASHDDAIVSCRVYVKPQDQMAYYVINDVEGKVSL